MHNALFPKFALYRLRLLLESWRHAVEHARVGLHFFLFDTTAPQVLYTRLCRLCIPQRQRRSRGERAPVNLGALCSRSGRGARHDFGSAYPHELELGR
jgi:hypothetical protein